MTRPLCTLHTLKAQAAPLLHRVAWLSGASICIARAQPALRVIMLHGVGDAGYPLEIFAAQLDLLERHFRVVALDRVLELARHPRRGHGGEVALTFDDGLRNNFTRVYPLLRERRLPATFYVCPGVIEEQAWIWTVEARVRLAFLAPQARRELAQSWGAPSPEVEALQGHMKRLPDPERRIVFDELLQASSSYRPSVDDRENYDVMSWHELSQLDPELITVGSHTVSHPMLTCCDPASQRHEIQESQAWLERRLSRPVRHFCYPDACHDPQVVQQVARCYDSAVTDVGLVRRGCDPFRLLRVPVAPSVPYLAWRLHRPHA